MTINMVVRHAKVICLTWRNNRQGDEMCDELNTLNAMISDSLMNRAGIV